MSNGRLFGSTGNRLFFLDRVTGEVVDLLDSVENRPSHIENLAQDRYGDLYIVGTATRLMRLELPVDVEAPEITASAQPPSPGPGRSALVRLTADDPRARIDYQIDEGEWTVYRRPYTLEAGQRTRFRAIDAAWNSSPVEELAL